MGPRGREEARDESYVDVLAEFEITKKSFDNFMELSFFLEDLFGRKVDLITTSGLDKYVRPYVEREVVWCEKCSMFFLEFLSFFSYLLPHQLNSLFQRLPDLRRIRPSALRYPGLAASSSANKF